MPRHTGKWSATELVVEFLDEGARPGADNMRRDCELLEAVESGRLLRPVLRFYAWTRPTVSVGYHQSDEVLHLSRLQRDGIDVVRRPTGGGAIWHEDEITYALVAGWPGPTRRVKRVYREIAAAFVRAFGGLGLAVTVGMGSARTPAACFAAVQAHELHVEGRKLVGSAMRAGRRGFLLHGSILGGASHLRIGGYLREPLDLRSRTTDLAAEGLAAARWPELKSAIHSEVEDWCRQAGS